VNGSVSQMPCAPEEATEINNKTIIIIIYKKIKKKILMYLITLVTSNVLFISSTIRVETEPTLYEEFTI
jgi:hypothetical protein